jgi:hypothetical protein
LLVDAGNVTLLITVVIAPWFAKTDFNSKANPGVHFVIKGLTYLFLLVNQCPRCKRLFPSPAGRSRARRTGNLFALLPLTVKFALWYVAKGLFSLVKTPPVETGFTRVFRSVTTTPVMANLEE